MTTWNEQTVWLIATGQWQDLDQWDDDEPWVDGPLWAEQASGEEIDGDYA